MTDASTRAGACPPAFDPRDPARLAALHAYAILDTPPEPAFDDIAQMAAQACDVPMAHINFIDADRQWIKAAVGHVAREMPLQFGFCTDALGADDVLVLPDLAAEHDRATNPMVVGEPHLRFYAGVPLTTPEGHAIGTLCVLDREPRRLTEPQIFILKALARTVMAQLEARRSAAALRRREEHYRSLFESIDAGFCLVEMRFDAQGRAADYRFLELNQAFARQTGLSDAAGRWMRELVPDHEQHWFDIYGAVARTGEPVRFENAANALGRWYDVYAYRVDDPALNHVAILFNDITERRRIETNLRASEAELRLVADAMPVLIAVVDRGLVYRFANAAYRLWLGQGPEAVVGRTIAEVVGPAEFEARREALARVLAGEEVRIEREWRWPDGRTRIADIRYMPRRAPGKGDAATDGFYVFVHDVTDAKRAETQLQSRAEQLEAQIVAQGRERDRIWTLSPVLKVVAGLDGRIRTVNPAWSRATGWSEADVAGRGFLDFVGVEDRPAAEVALQRLGEGRMIEDIELSSLVADGGRRRVLWTIVPDDGSLYGYGRDLTELRQAEDALRQSQKMEAVGQLTGGVAHDFNNLLTIIRSSVEFLRRPELPEVRKARYLDAVSDTVDRAAKLTGQLLAFARRQALKPEIFDAGARLQAIAEMLDQIMGARIRVAAALPEAPCFVRADASQFETALVNMAVNARDAMAGEGHLTLRLTGGQALPAIRGHAANAGPFAAVSVSDTGSGIAEADLARIFEPFFTTKEVGKGTGLGLSQVIGFAKQSGGDVAVASRPGETTFTLYLPQAEAPRAVAGPAAPASAPAGPGRGLCVLVVEDNLEVGRFCTQILEDLGHRPVWAHNAEAALAELAREGDGGAARFDAVFSDVVMPGMGGIALARRLRASRPDLPVVLTSGYSHVLAQDDAHGFELVRKPYSAEELARVLREAARREGVVTHRQ
ncbi:PAS domain-containing protein [Methylobacterium radiodurans]|uniref:histidine kinase n=1 Tax=Methylobacterium radiodurans TaxID=2202828 RepID=A0A2U8W104_9HYPH|nr:PAS domain-containing protein [Methylobacterium radiodurans]AWN38926.1 hybrid sensor histidine kinase/response regulator [Methylobacterium radiodurans]